MPDTLSDAEIAPLKDYISTTLLEGRAIANDENLLLSGLLDSLGVMSLVAFVEQHYGFAVPFDDVVIENFASLDAMASYIGAAQVKDA